MALTQKEVIAGSLAGVSLICHLCSASNFVPASEMGFFGAIFSYVHVLCNFAARTCLLSLVAIVMLELYRPRTICNLMGINYYKLSDVLNKLIIAALLSSGIRIILPGPVTYYSRLYKLGVILNTVGSILLVKSATGLLPIPNHFKKSGIQKSVKESDSKDSHRNR